MNNLRAEHELLICIARKSLDERVVDRLRALIQQEIDWDYLFNSASVHGLIPLLATHLLTVARDLIPEPILQQLRADCLESSKSNVYLVRELMRIIELFSGENIRMLAFKGPVLGELIYGDVGLRQAGDLDILIAKQDFVRAKDLLQSNRYLMAPQLTAGQQRSHLSSHCEIQFLHQDQFSVVDLHWGLTPKTFPFPLGFEELWARRQTIHLAGRSVETFSKEDLLLYLCVHGAKHYWTRLEWIAAVAEIARPDSAVNWSEVVHRARATNSRKILRLGLLLASSLFTLELPRKVNEMLNESEKLRKCALSLEEQMLVNMGASPSQVEIFRWNLKFMDRRRDAVQSFLRSIFVPTISDWQRMHLPDALYPLYFGTRPLALLRKYGKRRTAGNRNEWTQP